MGKRSISIEQVHLPVVGEKKMGEKREQVKVRLWEKAGEKCR